jgi:hypothetical protein
MLQEILPTLRSPLFLQTDAGERFAKVRMMQRELSPNPLPPMTKGTGSSHGLLLF